MKWRFTLRFGHESPESRPAAGSAPDRDRRGLLLGLAATGAALGAPATASAAAPADPAPARDVRSLAYRETDHVRTAYRRMRF